MTRQALQGLNSCNAMIATRTRLRALVDWFASIGEKVDSLCRLLLPMGGLEPALVGDASGILSTLHFAKAGKTGTGTGRGTSGRSESKTDKGKSGSSSSSDEHGEEEEDATDDGEEEEEELNDADREKVEGRAKELSKDLVNRALGAHRKRFYSEGVLEKGQRLEDVPTVVRKLRDDISAKDEEIEELKARLETKGGGEESIPLTKHREILDKQKQSIEDRFKKDLDDRDTKLTKSEQRASKSIWSQVKAAAAKLDMHPVGTLAVVQGPQASKYFPHVLRLSEDGDDVEVFDLDGVTESYGDDGPMSLDEAIAEMKGVADLEYLAKGKVKGGIDSGSRSEEQRSGSARKPGNKKVSLEDKGGKRIPGRQLIRESLEESKLLTGGRR